MYFFRDGDFEYAVCPAVSSDAAALRGSGSGDTFVPNPAMWRQLAIIGPLVIFVRSLAS